MRYLLICNPESGDGSARGRAERAARYLRRRGDEVELLFTERPGHAVELARAGAGGAWDAVVAAGGDGTVNEVVNGLVGGDARLGILPLGTGNEFASEMGFPERLGPQCRLLRRGSAVRLDLGRCAGRSFLLMMGAGFDAYSLMQLRGSGTLKRRLGLLAYGIGALRAFFRYRFPEISIEFADGRRDAGSLVIVSNTSRYGSFFSFTPRATPLDGLLDVFVFRPGGRWATLMLALRYFRSAPDGVSRRVSPPRFPGRKLYRTTGLSLSSISPVAAQMDGEVFAPLPLAIEVVPSAIEVILPARAVRRARRFAERGR